MAERLVRVAAEHVRACGHLLLAHKEALVVALVALPRQAALEQEEERVRERLEVVAARRGAPQVRVHARVAHGAAEDVGPLVVLDVRAADEVLPPRGCRRHRAVSHLGHADVEQQDRARCRACGASDTALASRACTRGGRPPAHPLCEHPARRTGRANAQNTHSFSAYRGRGRRGRASCRAWCWAGRGGSSRA